MSAYLEFTLQPDDEFPQHLLMDAFIAKLHRALVADGSKSIGISFPQWRDGDYPTLGSVIRLHGDALQLESLMQCDWLRGMRDHAQWQAPQAVPAQHTYVLVERRKTKSVENMRKRAIRRHGYSQEQAEQRIPASVGERLTLPYTTQYSASTGQRYRLFINQRPTDTAGSGGFNAHALSSGSAVPLF